MDSFEEEVQYFVDLIIKNIQEANICEENTKSKTVDT